MSFSFVRGDALHDPLHVVTAIINPQRWRSRVKLYERFALHMAESGANLCTVEVAYGDRDFAVTTADNPNHLQIRTRQELWHKENALNLLVERLPSDWQYLAWVDADIRFGRADWVDETLHALQHNKIVQLWEDAFDTYPNGTTYQSHKSFAWCYHNDIPETTRRDSYGPGQKGWRYYHHPGFAWAIRRDTFRDMGRFLDWALLGSGDYHMATAWVGRDDYTMKTKLHPDYIRLLKLWRERAARVVEGSIGWVPGTILHGWHGAKIKRGYRSRIDVLADYQFSPIADVCMDEHGLYQLAITHTRRGQRLRDNMARYFRDRDEDGCPPA